ncbi:MAG: hypothetical protein ACXVWU_12060 [Nocardioides sp.]
MEEALCREHVQGQTRYDAVLLASELVAQALVAGTRPTRLRLHCQVTRVEMAVDALGLELWSAGDFPRQRAFLIDELAPGWRVDYSPQGPTYRCLLGTTAELSEVPLPG